MRRLLVVLMVFFLILPVWAAGDTEEECVVVEHLLWDIPFGIDEEEFRALMMERAGLEFSEMGLEMRYAIHQIYCVAEDYETILGYPTRIEGLFDENQTFQQVYLSVVKMDENWYADSLHYPTADMLESTLEIMEKVTQEYGDITGGRVRVSNPARTKER